MSPFWYVQMHQFHGMVKQVAHYKQHCVAPGVVPHEKCCGLSSLGENESGLEWWH
jgi:hypothetical protein